MAVSPDGASVYSRVADRLLAFERDTSTGLLTQRSRPAAASPRARYTDCGHGVGARRAVVPAGGLARRCLGLRALGRRGGSASSATPPPGGPHQPWRALRGVASPTTARARRPGECESLGASGAALEHASSVAVTPSGRHVIVSGARGAVVFSRDSADGTLQMTDCVSQQVLAGCQHRPGVGGIGLSISPSGDSVVLPSSGGHQWFALDDDAGTLTPMPGAQGCWSGTGLEGCLALPASLRQLQPERVVAGRDVGLHRGAAPSRTSGWTARRCAHRSRRPPPHDTAVTVPAACTDPNGDAVSVSIVSQPALGFRECGHRRHHLSFPPRVCRERSRSPMPATASGRDVGAGAGLCEGRGRPVLPRRVHRPRHRPRRPPHAAPRRRPRRRPRRPSGIHRDRHRGDDRHRDERGSRSTSTVGGRSCSPARPPRCRGPAVARSS